MNQKEEHTDREFCTNPNPSKSLILPSSANEFDFTDYHVLEEVEIVNGFRCMICYKWNLSRSRRDAACLTAITLQMLTLFLTFPPIRMANQERMQKPSMYTTVQSIRKPTYLLCVHLLSSVS